MRYLLFGLGLVASSVASAGSYTLTCTETTTRNGHYAYLIAELSDKKYLKGLNVVDRVGWKIEGAIFSGEFDLSVPPTRFERQLRWTPICEQPPCQEIPATQVARLILPEGFESSTATVYVWSDGHYDQKRTLSFEGCSLTPNPSSQE